MIPTQVIPNHDKRPQIPSPQVHLELSWIEWSAGVVHWKIVQAEIVQGELFVNSDKQLHSGMSYAYAT